MKKKEFVHQNSVKINGRNVTSTMNNCVERQNSREKTLENRSEYNMKKDPEKIEESWYFVHI